VPPLTENEWIAWATFWGPGIGVLLTVWFARGAAHRDRRKNTPAEVLHPLLIEQWKAVVDAQVTYMQQLENKINEQQATIERLTRELRYQRRGQARRLKPPDNNFTC
jgi:hypothetical protein